jgi:Flp pilus assembly CpaF family ATPase
MPLSSWIRLDGNPTSGLSRKPAGRRIRVASIRCGIIPILLFGRKFRRRVINVDALVEEGTISSEDASLFKIVETAEEAWREPAESSGLSI